MIARAADRRGGAGYVGRPSGRGRNQRSPATGNGPSSADRLPGGGFVRAGQPLFQIDSSLCRAATVQAQANLARAQANATAASARAARFKPPLDMQTVSQQDYDDPAVAAQAARAAVAQPRASLDTARINLRFTSVPAPISKCIGRPLGRWVRWSALARQSRWQCSSAPKAYLLTCSNPPPILRGCADRSE